MPPLDTCAAKLRVLADPTRLEVMRLLGDRPLVVGEIAATLGVEQSLLSHHLRVLRDAELVRVEAEGQARRYYIVSSRTNENTLDLGCCQITFQPGS